MPIQPDVEYVLLAADGTATVTPGGAAFWERPETELNSVGLGWLITEFECDQDWSSWEMHPAADEFVYLLSGEIDFLLETAQGVQLSHIVGRGAILVPRGVWHTARVFSPSRILFVTMGSGTQHKVVGVV